MKEQKVSKTWGEELWFANNEKYCGKLLSIKKYEWSSQGKFHYHKIKDETFFVITGKLIIEYVDESNMFYSITLYPHQSFRVAPGIKHRFSTSSRKCEFIEASTTHSEHDSYRCEWNKNTQEWN